MNVKNYFGFTKHIVYSPSEVLRRYENDLPSEESLLQRIALISLPFLGMIKPISAPLSMVMGSCRCVTCLVGTVKEGAQKNLLGCAKGVAQTSLAIMALAFSILHFQVGLLVTTGFDLGASALKLIQLLKDKHYQEAFEEALQLSAGSFYLALMLKGTLEYILISTLINVALSIHQASKEYQHGRNPEALAKLILGSFRLHQAQSYYRIIEQRNELLSLQKYKETFLRLAKGRDVKHLLSSPLIHLKERIEQGKAKLPDGQGGEIDFGSYFHGHGKGAIKGANLCFRTKIIDNQEFIELDFKLNHVHSAKIHKLLSELQKMDSSDLQTLVRLSSSHANSIHTKEIDFCVGSLTKGSGIEVTLEGLGSILVGSDPDLPNLYDRVAVRLRADQSIFVWHELLAFLDLEDAIKQSTLDDLERLKMGHLYRIFCPREATVFERTEEFFSLSIEDLKKTIVEKSPEMKETFQIYLPKMVAKEILPGKIRYSIVGLADLLRAQGAKDLTCAVTGDFATEDELFQRISMILSLGMLSTETRSINGIGKSGLGSNGSSREGGEDSVFTQMITDLHADPKNLMYSFGSDIRILFSLEAMETGTYQHCYDILGTRVNDLYFKRLNPVEFVNRIDEMQEIDFYQLIAKQLQSLGFNLEELNKIFSEFGGFKDFALELLAMQGYPAKLWEGFGHEVMIKERLDPSYITGILVKDEHLRCELIRSLRERDLIQREEISGLETIRGIPIDSFIHVA